MTAHRYKVGIVGLRSDSWAAVAHIPALRALSSDYELVGVANSTRASAESAAAEFGIPCAYGSAADLANAAEIDIVVVTVKASHHKEIATAAIDAGKHVYCEWPFGASLTEAAQMTENAQGKGILGVVGLQAPFAPEMRYLKHLLSEGFIGEVLSTTVIGSGLAWGAQIDRANSYLLDLANGATLLTIPVSHALSAVQDILGSLSVWSAMLVNRRKFAHVLETGKQVPMTTQDQVLIQGMLDGGVPIALHYRGGTPKGTGYLWEINGTEGDIQLTASIGHPQMVQLSLAGAREGEMRKLEVPASYRSSIVASAAAANVARVYGSLAVDLHQATSSAPTFAQGLELRRTIAEVETAASWAAANSDRSFGQ
jgi:predicted dehydrogenase